MLPSPPSGGKCRSGVRAGAAPHPPPGCWVVGPNRYDPCRDLGAALRTEAGEDVLHVRRHRLRRDGELSGDLPVRPPHRDERGHLELSRRQRRPRLLLDPSGSERAVELGRDPEKRNRPHGLRRRLCLGDERCRRRGAIRTQRAAGQVDRRRTALPGSVTHEPAGSCGCQRFAGPTRRSSRQVEQPASVVDGRQRAGDRAVQESGADSLDPARGLAEVSNRQPSPRPRDEEREEVGGVANGCRSPLRCSRQSDGLLVMALEVSRLGKAPQRR